MYQIDLPIYSQLVFQKPLKDAGMLDLKTFHNSRPEADELERKEFILPPCTWAVASSAFGTILRASASVTSQNTSALPPQHHRQIPRELRTLLPQGQQPHQRQSCDSRHPHACS